MAQRIDFNGRSNDELARLLYQNSSQSKPPKASALPPDSSRQDPEPLASRRVSELPLQTWPLSDRRFGLGPVSEREKRSLFAALSKGTKVNLGREPTVPELMLLLQRLNDARAFVSEAERAMQGANAVYVKDGRVVFSRQPQRQDGTSAA